DGGYAAARRDVFASVLRGDTGPAVISEAEVGGHLATAVERRVESAVRVVTCQGEVIIGGWLRGETGDQDIAVGLDDDGPSTVLSSVSGRNKVGKDLAADAEGGIERAGEQQAAVFQRFEGQSAP